MTDLGAAVQPIGTVHTAYTDKAHTPVQSSLNPSDVGRVVLDAPYHDGLDALADFDFAWLLTWLPPDPVDPMPPTMRQVPFLLSGAPRPIGLFAMRGPRRPNPIGLHLVRVVRVLVDGFEFAGVDMIDGTPLLDVKPYVASLDTPPGTALDSPIRSGWFDAADLGRAHTPASLRGDDTPHPGRAAPSS